MTCTGARPTRFLSGKPAVGLIAESKFDCRDRDGSDFVALLQIGRPVELMHNDRPYAECRVSLEPLFPERGHGGADTFQSLCLAIELIRKALRAFVAHGGSVYYHQTRTPIDIDHPSFVPIAEPIDKRFLASMDDD